MTAMSLAPVLLNLDERGVASLALNRPEVGNADDGLMIEALLATIDALSSHKELRVAVLTGMAKHFQAGADLAWLRRLSEDSREANVRASDATARAVARLNRLPVPTLALVQGACFGGGMGIAAACDIVIAADNAVFSIAEVRWGLTAAIVIPELSAAISARQLRRYALTGERFNAREAHRIGLIHLVVALQDLAAAGAAMTERLLASAPLAMAETTELLIEPANLADRNGLVLRHAAKRQSEEAREGLAAFAEKRAARWSR
jgi:methylglutaconyl-CoA hydratase